MPLANKDSKGNIVSFNKDEFNKDLSLVDTLVTTLLAEIIIPVFLNTAE